MNINNPTTFGIPGLTLSTSNSSGTGGALRADDTILVYDTTNPTTIAFSASPAVGSASTSARRDHTHGMAATTAAASEAEMVAASSTTVYASPGRTQYHPGVAKGWVLWEQEVAHGITVSHNWISVTDGTAAGDTDHVIDTDFSTANYVAVGCADNAKTISDISADRGVGTMRTVTRNSSFAGEDNVNNSIAVFGTQ